MYRWDVSEGDYRMVVNAPGYETATSREVHIPPAVTGLDIELTRKPGTGPPSQSGRDCGASPGKAPPAGAPQRGAAQAPRGAPQTQPASPSSGVRHSAGHAALRGPSGCVRRRFTARAEGTSIARVVFALDRRKPLAVSAADGKGGFSLKVIPSRLRGRVHRLKAKVYFTPDSGTPPQTLRLTFQRCPRKVSPKFTG
jgi:hypothetical protein